MLKKAVTVIAATTLIMFGAGGVATAAPAKLTDCGLILENQAGDCVSMLQSALNAEHPSYGLDVDGKFGPATRTAVLDFQGRHHLPADGNAGPITLNELESLTSSVATPRPRERVPVTDTDVCRAAWLVPDGKGGCTEPEPGLVAGGKPIGECARDQYEKLLKDIANRKNGIAGKAIAVGKGGLKRLIAPAQVIKCVWWDLPDGT